MLRAQTSTHKIGRTPVTVVYEEFSKAGFRAHDTHYYRSDGSYALSVLMEGDTQAPPTHVEDLKKKLSFLKDPATGLLDEFALTQRRYDQLRQAPLSCEVAMMIQNYDTCEPLGNDEVLGYRVQKYTTKIQNRPGRMTEHFLAPDLDFIPLLRYSKHDGKIEATKRAISIRVGEPDESVFTLPSNYRKVESSEFISAMETARGRGIPFTADLKEKFDQRQREMKTQSEIHKVQ